MIAALLLDLDGTLLEDEYLGELPEGVTFRLFDDATAALDAAEATGLAIAIVANGPSILQRSKLDSTGLTGRVAAVAISGEVGSVKPEPGIFEFALAALGVDAASAVMVGDSLENDIAGARSAGITSVWINRTRADAPERDQPDHTIESLTELPDLLGSLGRTRR